LSPIVIDTSAILAILRDEPEKDAFLESILAALAPVDVFRQFPGRWARW
jgi:uncharacterized protein with PIN domain